MKKAWRNARKNVRKNKARKKNSRLYGYLDSFCEIRKLASAGDDGAMSVLRVAQGGDVCDNVKLFRDFCESRGK